MQSINTKRVKGKGIGNKIDFPTINIHITDPIDLGLYFCILKIKMGWDYRELNCLMNVSELNGTIVGEINVPSIPINALDIEVGEALKIDPLIKLREGRNFKNRSQRIEEDLVLFASVRQRSCENCQLCYAKDFGYSNWTVEGTDWGCYADGPFDKLGVRAATICEYFTEGDYWRLDVDGEEPGPSEEWIKSTVREAKINSLIK